MRKLVLFGFHTRVSREQIQTDSSSHDDYKHSILFDLVREDGGVMISMPFE